MYLFSAFASVISAAGVEKEDHAIQETNKETEA